MNFPGHRVDKSSHEEFDPRSLNGPSYSSNLGVSMTRYVFCFYRQTTIT